MSTFLWTQTDDVGPSARFEHAMCFDPGRARTLLFGGSAPAGFLDDTWQRTANGWTQIADTGPAGRARHAMCFDATADVALLFGGDGSGTTFGDTWTLADSAWTQVEDSGPAARFAHGLAFDAKGRRAILFGGMKPDGTVTADTWQWNPTTAKWTQIADTGPSGRAFHCMAYDLVSERVVLFGGEAQDGTVLRDTWALEGDVWTQVAHFGAPASSRAAMVGTDVGVALFVGATAGSPPAPLSATWRFVANRWTQRQDIGPSGRAGHAMAFDTGRRAVILFGGRAPIESPEAEVRFFADTWEHIETEASLAPKPGPNPNEPNPNNVVPGVGGVHAEPNPVQAGGQVTVSVALDGSSTQTTIVRTAWILQSVFDASNNNGQPPPPGDVHFLPDLAIPPGVAQGTFGFVAPSVNEPAIVFLAATDNGVVAAEILTIN